MIPRILLLPAVGLILAATLSAPKDHPTDPPRSFFEPRDFVEYWSAARVLAVGGDPYDATQLLPVQRIATGNPDLQEVVSLWTPPWTLPLYRPFGFEPFAVARYIWLALQLLLVALSVELLWRAFGGTAGAVAMVPQLLALGFAPVFWMHFFGQNTGILLLGLSGFLYFRARNQPGIAGAFAALTALKPHVLALFGVALLLDGLNRSGRKSLLVGIAVIAAGAGVALALQPELFGQFVAAIRKPRTPEAVPLSDWQVPLLAYQLRFAVNPDAFWLQFLPGVLGCLAVVPYFWLRRKTWDWHRELPRLVLGSTILAPYGGWMFDLTVLLVPVVAVAAVLPKTDFGLGRMVLATGFVLLFLLGTRLQKLHEFLWFAPAVAGMWASWEWVRPRNENRSVAARIAEPLQADRVRISPPTAPV